MEIQASEVPVAAWTSWPDYVNQDRHSHDRTSAAQKSKGKTDQDTEDQRENDMAHVKDEYMPIPPPAF